MMRTANLFKGPIIIHSCIIIRKTIAVQICLSFVTNVIVTMSLKIKQTKGCGNLKFFLKILPEITFVLKIQKIHIPFGILIFMGVTLQLDIKF